MPLSKLMTAPHPPQPHFKTALNLCCKAPLLTWLWAASDLLSTSILSCFARHIDAGLPSLAPCISGPPTGLQASSTACWLFPAPGRYSAAQPSSLVCLLMRQLLDILSSFPVPDY